MKKLLLGMFFMGVSHFASAQEIGVRFGDVTGNLNSINKRQLIG